MENPEFPSTRAEKKMLSETGPRFLSNLFVYLKWQVQIVIILLSGTQLYATNSRHCCDKKQYVKIIQSR